jgi:EAL domain-containing protein (putative c-di-GMP-specific phosphodiesterase class I)
MLYEALMRTEEASLPHPGVVLEAAERTERIYDVGRAVQRIVRSMVQLCHDMGKQIVAEGIETEREREVLVDLGCDLLQGYLFARPGRPFPMLRGSSRELGA